MVVKIVLQRVFSVVAVCALISSPTGAANRDLATEIERVESAHAIGALSSDATGSRLAFAKTSHYWALNKVSKLGVLDTKSGNVTWLGKQYSHKPRFSPDGTRLAFISGAVASGWNRTESGDQIYVASTDGRGAPEAMTSDVSVMPVDLAWSPDGKRIAFIAKLASSQPVASKKDIGRTDADRSNGPTVTVVGPSGEALAQLGKEIGAVFILEVASKRVERVTPESLNVEVFAKYGVTLDWSPDSAKLAFSARPLGATVGGNAGNANDVYWIDVKTRKLSRPIGRHLADTWPRWSPDGAKLAMISAAGESVYAMDNRILIHDVLTGQESELLGGEFLISLTRQGDGPKWSKDGRSLWVRAAQMSRSFLARIDIHSGRVVEEIRLPGTLADFAIAGSERKFVVASTATLPDEIYEIRKDGASQLSHFNSEVFSGRAELVSWTSADGLPMEGVLIVPNLPKTHAPFPTVVHLMGGPGGVFRNDFESANAWNPFGPADLYLRRGYAVFMPNTRAADSSPASHRRAFQQHWGDEYKLDVDTGIDALIARGVADPNRLAIAGHSYGAYLTAVAITQTTRFKAALFSDGMVNLLGDDLQKFPDFEEFYGYYFGGSHAQRREAMIERSPILTLDRARTPVLVRAGNLRLGDRTHGMLDQARQLFAALRLNNVPSMLIIHNYEGHGVADPLTYRDYTRRNLAWLDYFVLGKGANPLQQNASS